MVSDVTFFWDTESTWKKMYEACASATESIDFESYIFSSDVVGQKFLDLFIKKSREGVRVRLLVDFVGSFGLLNDSRVVLLRNASGTVIFFNPISPWRIHTLFSWVLRDHRKVAVIDDRVAFIGGVNIDERMRFWRDTHARWTGPIVNDFANAFEKMWAVARTPRFLQFKKRFPKPKKTGNVSFFTNSPRFKQRFIYSELRTAFRMAKKSILIQTPYFVPSLRLLRLLTRARRRGVAVTLMIPTVFDVALAGYATEFFITHLLRCGVVVYRYIPRFLHAKVVVVDGEWASMGSANIDNLSLSLNYESNVVIRDQQIAYLLQKQFWIDSKHCHQVDERIWKDRSWIQRCKEVLTIPLHGVL